MKRIITISLLLAMLLTTTSFGAGNSNPKGVSNQQGWVFENSIWRYYKNDGRFASREDLEIGDKVFHFNSIGYTKECTLKQPVQIPKEAAKSDLEKKIDSYADSVLEEIITDNMTERQKIRAVYNWVRANMSYVDHAAKDDWVQAAYDGFRAGSGDCFTYYSLSIELLTRLGYSCIEVIRNDGHHWWCLVNFGEGWYHFDCTPRRTDDADFCLVTDAALQNYATAHTNARGYTTHSWDRKRYPATPEK